MFGPDSNAPRVTCETCGETYVDDSDWSGPAHSERDCVRVLKARVEAAEKVAAAERRARIATDAWWDSTTAATISERDAAYADLRALGVEP